MSRTRITLTRSVTAAAAALGLAAALAAPPALADITIGVSVSATGPGASLGVPIQNTFALLPKSIGGEAVKYVILDDASDPTAGAKNARRFATEDKVDVIIGSSAVPVAQAQAAIASEMRIPFIALCPIGIDPAKQPFIFAVPQPVPLMIDAVVEHMKSRNVRNVAFIGFSDPWGDLTYRGLVESGKAAGINVTTNERYGRTDTTVAAQILKIMATNPDAVFIGGSGTPGALPQLTLTERGYKGPVYHTHGVVNRDFLRVGGKAIEGGIAPTGPFVVVEQLPDAHPSKAVGADFVKRYEAQYGAGTRNAFAGYAYDAALIVNAAVVVAQKKAKTGTQAFREAMRDAIEGTKDIAGTHGVYSMSPTNHYGTDQRARVLVRVEAGDWKLVR